jgi:hypothetical protein
MYDRTMRMLLVCVLTGCGSPLVIDERAPEAAPSVTEGVGVNVTTYVVPTASNVGGRISATWAAYRLDDGSWTAMSPRAAGTYALPLAKTRYAVAFVCSDGEDVFVTVHEEGVAQTQLEVMLERGCGDTRTDRFTISGTLFNAAPAGWLDFGYALEERGVVLPVAGSNASYEEVNVASGTWDLIFGLRPESYEPIRKLAIVRSQSITTDATMDVNLEGAFTPESARLVVRGIDAARETVEAPVRYTLNGGTRGIDLGPTVIPKAAEISVAYGTVPASLQATTDGYRAEILAVTSGDDVRERGVTATFHAASDLDITLPSAIPMPTFISISSPYLRFEAPVSRRASAARYELEARVRVSNRAERRWQLVVAAALSPDVLTLPDLSAAAGFDISAWTLPEGRRELTMTIRDAPLAIAGGTLTSYSTQNLGRHR